MSIPNVRRNIRRYRADHPYSHHFLFLALDVFVSVFKIALLCLALAVAWLALKWWMDSLQQPSAIAAQAVIEESAVIQIPKEDSTPQPETRVADSESILDQKAPEPVNLLDEEWLLSQVRSSYTMQLGSSPEKQKLIDFANELALDSPAHIFAFKVSRIGNPIYGLAFGLYPDLQTAQQSIEKLPASYRQFDPWIRPMGELHDQINDVKEKLKAR